jgi:hypothetical protein
MTDYKTLLKKYMQHVIECEGISFVSHINDYTSDVLFTDEEAEELRKIDNEV